MSNLKRKIISLEVRDEYILGSGVAIGAQGSFDSVWLRVKFDENWMGLNIHATWTDALGKEVDQQVVTALDLADDISDTYDIPVPQLVTTHAGTVKLALSGYVIGGEAGDEIESLFNTVSGVFRVLASGAARLDGGTVAATDGERLLAALNKALNSEKERYFAELTRQQNEEERILKENIRFQDEETRQRNEDARVETEALRAEAEKARAEAEANRAKQIGDINTTLDAIIAIQNTLIGGDE